MKTILFLMSIIAMLLTSCNSSNNSNRQAPDQEEIGEVLSLISTNIKSWSERTGVSYLIYYDKNNYSYVNLDDDTTSVSATVIVYKNKYTITVVSEDVPIVVVNPTFQSLGNYPSQDPYFKSLANHISRGFYKAKKAENYSAQSTFYGYLLWTEYQNGKPYLRFEEK